MDCYVCACDGKEERAVALCPFCSVGLCMKHLADVQTHTQGGMRYSCNHSLPQPAKVESDARAWTPAAE